MGDADAGREQRVHELTRRIREAERELEALTGGQLDAFTDDAGRPWLLHAAQVGLLDREAALRKLTAELEHERARLLAAQRVAQVGSWETDPASLEVVWSEQTHRIFGTDPKHFRPTHPSFLERVHPEDRERVDKAFVNSLTVAGPHSIEHRILVPDVGARVVEERWETSFDDEGRARLVVGTCQDITARVEAEESLRQSQSMLRIAGHAARLGGWMLDLPAKRLTWTDEVCEIHDLPAGYQPTLDEGLSYFAPEHRAQIAQLLERCIQEGQSYDVELPKTTAKGRRIWVRTLGEAVRDAQGRVTRVQGGIQDITDRRLAQQELDRINRALRMLSDCNAALLRTTDERQLLEQICRIGVEVGGYRMAWVGYPLDDPWRTVQPQASAGVEDGYLAEVKLSWSAEVPEGRGPAGRTLRDGVATMCLDMETDPDFLWWPLARQRGYRSVTCLPLREGARTFGVLGLYSAEPTEARPDELRLLQELADDLAFGIVTLRSRHQQLRAEQQLAQQAALLDQATDAIFVLDLARRVTFWNRGAERLYGVLGPEARDRPMESLLAPSNGDSLEELLESMAEVLAAGEWSGEVARRTRDGRALTVQARWTLLREPNGAPRAVLAIETDVTERKKLENQFLRSQRMESIGTLAGGIAHDLNNVLAPILASVGVLRSVVTDPDDLEMVELLQSCAQRGADLVKQVLTFARGVEGRRVPVRPLHLLREIQGIVRDTFPKNVVCELRSERAQWDISGDPTQLHQVFMNLVVNARDAMPRGGRLTINVENAELDDVFAEMHPDARPGRYVLVSVTDTGSGIPQAIQEVIFEPFFTTKAIGHGTGLGLSTTQAIVRSHKGFMTLTSELQKGTTFRVYLPAMESSASEDAPERERALPRGAGELLLVVDDEQALRLVARRTLEQFGYRVVLAANGAEGVAAYARMAGEIALVITDMAMPIMDGPAMLAALRTINPHVRVIGSSGLLSPGSREAFVSSLTHFLPKPYTAEALLEAVRLALHPRPGT